MDRISLVLDILEAQNVIANLQEVLSRLVAKSNPALSKEAASRVVGRISLQPVIDLHMHMYDDYSDEDLKVIHTFVTSNTGKRMVADGVALSLKMGSFMENWLPELDKELLPHVTDELAKLAS